MIQCLTVWSKQYDDFALEVSLQEPFANDILEKKPDEFIDIQNIPSTCINKNH